ncbi:unnamed protein product [Phytomonas sp. EM1]|nr:unnamed protein product [Phytomonas sp. EM1]|eukprot:CCW60723.1 unnamed protein product [Phytomonas sp. isolate EM1]
MHTNKEHMENHETAEVLATSNQNFEDTLSDTELKPCFGWYQPRFWGSNANHTVGNESGGQGGKSFFFDSTRKLLVDDVTQRKSESDDAKNFDRPHKEKKVSTASTYDDFEKLFAPLGRATPIEDIFWGPPLSKKRPPATDYERLLTK